MKRLAPLAAIALASCNGLAMTSGTDTIVSASVKAAPDPSEVHRPDWHYTPPRGWMNDPNGLVYHDGEYHLFYQYYPNDTVWGPMHWGHAISRDLAHWETLPIALAPERDGYVFSGSAISDRENTARFGKDALIAIYTIHDPLRSQAGQVGDESQGLAFSLDRGRTFSKFSGNPVLANPGDIPDFRDPSVFRDPVSDRWVMALAVTDHVRFYASGDLKTWDYLSSFRSEEGGPDGVWECPNLFPIRDERTGKTKWVLLLSVNRGGPQGGSGTQYFVGDWDGSRFTLDPEFLARTKHERVAWLDYGADNYAGLTWSGVPDDRRIFIGWMSNWAYAEKVPASISRGAMTAPRELTLSGTVLRQQPAKELSTIRGRQVQLDVEENRFQLPSNLLPSAELDLVFRLPQSGEFAIRLSNGLGENAVIGLDRQGWYIDRSEARKTVFHEDFAAVHRASKKRDAGMVRVRVMIDRTSIELFADNGETVMTDTFFPTDVFTSGEISWSVGGQLRAVRAWPLSAASPTHAGL